MRIAYGPGIFKPTRPVEVRLVRYRDRMLQIACWRVVAARIVCGSGWKCSVGLLFVMQEPRADMGASMIYAYGSLGRLRSCNLIAGSCREVISTTLIYLSEVAG